MALNVFIRKQEKQKINLLSPQEFRIRMTIKLTGNRREKLIKRKARRHEAKVVL